MKLFYWLSGIVRIKIPDEIDCKQLPYILFEPLESSGTFTERVPKIVKLTASVKILWLQAILEIHLDSEEVQLKILD